LLSNHQQDQVRFRVAAALLIELYRLPAAVLRRCSAFAAETEGSGDPDGQAHRGERTTDELHTSEATGKSRRPPAAARSPVPNPVRADRGSLRGA
jgi:hypothetical protein